jgi:hypothetical protein
MVLFVLCPGLFFGQFWLRKASAHGPGPGAPPVLKKGQFGGEKNQVNKKDNAAKA